MVMSAAFAAAGAAAHSRAAAARLRSLVIDEHGVRYAADRHRFYRLHGRHVDNGDVVGQAVGHDGDGVVVVERDRPGAAADQHVLDQLLGRGIDDGDMVGAAEANKRLGAVLGHFEPNGRYVLDAEAGRDVFHHVLDLVGRRVDHVDLARELGGDPELAL